MYDHTVQVIDLIETYREISSGLTDTWMSAVSNRMNEVMKVLTIIATIFIPLSFLAGVYGMNFDDMPELHQWWAYPLWWGICFAVATVSCSSGSAANAGCSTAAGVCWKEIREQGFNSARLFHGRLRLSSCKAFR